MSLARQLGHGPDERLLIINADDYGMCHAANTGITSLLEARAVSSATVMLPCAWAPDAIARAKAGGFDAGVHLTFTSEWQDYRWGPVAKDRPVPTLVDDAGFFPRDPRAVEENADAEDVRTEILAQLSRATALGLDPSHLDNHMVSLHGLHTGRHFLDVVLDVCADRGLPFRLPRSPEGFGLPAAARPLHEEAVRLADAAGVVLPDHLRGLPFHRTEGETYESFRESFITMIRTLAPGVTEVFLHPFSDTAELRAITPEHTKRAWELRVLTDPEAQSALRDVTLIGWSRLRDVQRA
ncbi:polysaccharide deacetylase family protein [Kitasatospora sp. NPDC057500]|uniref:polysaccharide deacetylase family protein n=1 Tax=Kitasatospora sp. NPDC057500 TaxID=3346151 RepID=UPI0036B8D1E4